MRINMHAYSRACMHMHTSICAYTADELKQSLFKLVFFIFRPILAQELAPGASKTDSLRRTVTKSVVISLIRWFQAHSVNECQFGQTNQYAEDGDHCDEHHGDYGEEMRSTGTIMVVTLTAIIMAMARF